MVREWKEQHSFVGERAEPVRRHRAGEGRADAARHHRRDAAPPARSLVPPIVETMLDLLPRVEPEFQERVRKNIILAGGGGLIRDLGPTLERALETSRRRQGQGHRSAGVRRLRRRPGPRQRRPESDWDRLVN